MKISPQGRFLRASVLLLMILYGGGPIAQVVAAQTSSGWAPPVNVSAGIATTPPQGWGAVIAADQDGVVHATWPECSTDEATCKSDTIYYAKWQEGTWSQPVDILAAPVGEGVVTQSLTVDPYGRLVLVWMGNRGLNISIADKTGAGSARAWTTTTLAPQEAVRTADLVISNAGVFHLVYIANDRLILHSISEDAGATWFEPVTIYVEERGDAAAIAPKIATDHHGNVFVCWTATSEAVGWGAVGVQFTSSSDGGTTWVPLQALAEDAGYGSCALLVDREARLHAFWLGSGGIGGRYHRWSSDDGATWTTTEAVAAPGQITGFPGAPRLLEDSRGIVHVVFPGYGPTGEQIWHARWDDGVWTRPVPISADLPHSEKSAATLVDGKYLHVIWLEYQSLDYWHSYVDTGGPAVRTSASSLPTAPPTDPPPTLSPMEHKLTPTETPEVQLSSPEFSQEIPAPLATSDAFVLALAIGPAAILVSGVVLSRLLKRR